MAAEPARRAAPRTLLSESPALRRLCDEYAAELLAAGYDEASRHRLDQDTLPGGVVLDERARRVYREAVTPADPTARLAGVPNPLTDPAGLVAWLREPEDPAHPAWLSRYLMHLHRERRDLKQAFPQVPGQGRPPLPRLGAASRPGGGSASPRLSCPPRTRRPLPASRRGPWAKG